MNFYPETNTYKDTHPLFSEILPKFIFFNLCSELLSTIPIATPSHEEATVATPSLVLVHFGHAAPSSVVQLEATTPSVIELDTAMPNLEEEVAVEVVAEAEVAATEAAAEVADMAEVPAEAAATEAAAEDGPDMDEEEAAAAAAAAAKAARPPQPQRRMSVSGWNILSPHVERERHESDALVEVRPRGRPKKRRNEDAEESNSGKRQRRAPAPILASTPANGASRVTRASSQKLTRSTRSGKRF